MTKAIDGTKVPHHGLFYMENAGGLQVEPASRAPIVPDERQPSCFALEDEKGEDWKGSDATGSQIREARSTL